MSDMILMDQNYMEMSSANMSDEGMWYNMTTNKQILYSNDFRLSEMIIWVV